MLETVPRTRRNDEDMFVRRMRVDDESRVRRARVKAGRGLNAFLTESRQPILNTFAVRRSDLLIVYGSVDRVRIGFRRVLFGGDLDSALRPIDRGKPVHE